MAAKLGAMPASSDRMRQTTSATSACRSASCGRASRGSSRSSTSGSRPAPPSASTSSDEERVSVMVSSFSMEATSLPAGAAADIGLLEGATPWSAPTEIA